MSQHEDMVRLRHMLASAQEACSLISGKRRAELDANHLLELALTRLLEIVGEAVKNIPDSFQYRPHITPLYFTKLLSPY
jgi:uncharacterized protein with HEPN domain